MLARVSVLIPCFNAAPFLGAALDSVLAQTYPYVEIIVTDDGSSDGSAAIVENYAAHGVQLISQNNRGASVARNRAFEVSTGDFVIFMDADDIIGPRHLESLVARLADERRCVALSRWDRFYSAPEEARFPERPTERNLAGIDWLVLDWEDGRPMAQSGMILIPRRLIEEHGGWHEDLTLSDDFEFFARIISHSDGVRFAPDAKLYYRSGQTGSLSGWKSRKAVESAYMSIMLGISHVLAVENSPRTRRVCANIVMDFEYANYPDHADLRLLVRRRATELGGSSRGPGGPPGFHTLRRFIGWKLARRVQRFAERYGFNGAGRSTSGGGAC